MFVQYISIFSANFELSIKLLVSRISSGLAIQNDLNFSGYTVCARRHDNSIIIQDNHGDYIV